MTSAVLGNGLTQTDVYSPMSTRLTGATLLAANGTRRLEEGYGYDKLGNVSYRNQQWNGHGFIETFDYDELNRLKSSAIGSDVKTINYHPDGRIRNKTGVGSGDYAYPTPGAGSVRPNGVTSIAGIGNFQYDDNGNLLSGAGRTISWTAFDMPMTIARGGASGTFVYGPEHQRARQDRGDGTSVVYADRQETELGAGGSVTLKTYWPLGIGVEIDRPGKATELRWTHTDRLGSPIALSDEAGLVQEELAYDPWGKRRDPVSHATPDTLDGKIDNKGFTNHEMLDQLDLVHMNGRVYDPFVARFLSGDPIIQDPTNGQNYDRYSYVFNNPTNFTDPTGFMCDGGMGNGQLCKGMSLSPQNFNDASTSASKAWQKEEAAARANASSGRPVNENNTRAANVKNQGGQNSANPSVSGLDPKGLPSAGLDAIKAGWNTGLNIFEGGINLLTGALPGGSDYVPFTNGARASYDTPVFGEIVEFLAPVAALKVMRGGAPERLPQDVNVNPTAPAPLPTSRPIGTSATQNAEAQRTVARLRTEGYTDIRVNQQQVNALGSRVGVNRPDIQATSPNGQRVYIELDRTSSNRGVGHEVRIKANDPAGKVILRTVN